MMSKIIIAGFVAVALAKSSLNLMGYDVPVFHSVGWEATR